MTSWRSRCCPWKKNSNFFSLRHPSATHKWPQKILAQSVQPWPIIYLKEDEFESEPKIRIVIPPSHRYQAMLAVHVQEHWGVQRTMQQVQKVFYWPGWRKDTSIFVTECAGCLHKEQINLKDLEPHEDLAKNVNDVLCIDLVGPISMSSNKNNYILTMLDKFS